MHFDKNWIQKRKLKSHVVNEILDQFCTSVSQDLIQTYWPIYSQLLIVSERW